METNQEQLSHKESLLIIKRMIETAKGDISSSSFYFILWGWIVVIASSSHFVLSVYTDIQSPFMVWLITIPGWIVSFIYGYKKTRQQHVSTYSSGLVMWTWIAFSLCILIIIFSGSKINYNISAMIILFSAFATFLTGIIISFRPLIIGGIISWLLVPVAFYVGPVYAQLVIAGSVMVSYLIPAYLLRRKVK